MIASRWLRRAVLAIGWLTLMSGALQMVTPATLLEPLDAASDPTSRHFFAIVGMFMVLFGGLLVHALRRGSHARVPLLWIALQKFGASAAVALGVARGVFSGLALGVAGFDLLSALLILAHRRGLRE